MCEFWDWCRIFGPSRSRQSMLILLPLKSVPSLVDDFKSCALLRFCSLKILYKKLGCLLLVAMIL